VDVRTAGGHVDRFDHVVIAAHADQALAMLVDPTPREKELLGEWEYSRNDTWLHTDTRLLPRRRAAWASWNYRLADCRSPEPAVSLSYWMNRLQPLGTDLDHVVTLNPDQPPAADTVLRRMTYTHPGFTPASVATQPVLGEIQGRRRTWYAGAYHRFGFHEDGLVSALRVAARFGIRWPS
jgi:predicted NAD/FAD-binding protein